MDDVFFENWKVQLRKGMLELCILNTISNSRCYGYDIVRSLRGVDGLVISEGTIYPILSRLKKEGLVETTLEESASGPPRKYYELSAKGRELIRRMNDYWNTVAGGAEAMKEGGHENETES